ncbi:MAG: winged helix-turn-helix transcriptional regulator [Nitrososphaeria archaeon]|nr:winged helix-turn-helix transcriptional regulator [Nitrososphaeria archaeon]MDW8021856.1 winged helix-turn-helix transcriptional regulator [Nitrososphaerota archaeon]
MKITGLLLALLVFFAAAQAQGAQVTIDPDGVVSVRFVAEVEEGLNVIPLPVEPIPESIMVQINESKLVPIYEGDSLYVFSPQPGSVEITYLANISVTDNVFSFEVRGDDLVKLILNPEIVLLSVPDNAVAFTYIDGGLLIEFYGPQVIEYVIRKMATSTSSQSSTATTTTATHTEKATAPPTETYTSIAFTGTEVAFWAQFGLIAAGLVIAIAAASSVLLLRRRGRSRFLREGLSNVDLEILRLIKGSGGSMMQGDLQAVLRLPKTTLWRHVRKLEELGYIEIVKEGPFNKLLLIRDFE